MTSSWKDTFVDKCGQSLIVNGRLGCFSIRNGVLSFATGLKRHVSIDVVIGENGITVFNVVGKKNYSQEDTLVITKKLVEIVADYERWGKR